jgi:hypothetical protein
MNKIYLILIPCIIFASCSEGNIKNSYKEKEVTKEFQVGDNIKLESYVIDSCEYIGFIVAKRSNDNYLTHKGNCKFCAKRNQK